MKRTVLVRMYKKDRDWLKLTFPEVNSADVINITLKTSLMGIEGRIRNAKRKKR